MSTVTLALSYSLIPAGAILAAGLLASFWLPGPRLTSHVQHFAAGVVLAALGAEVLPDVMHGGNPLGAGVGFAIGTATMLSIRWVAEKLGRGHGAKGEHGASDHESEDRARPIATLVATIGVDLFVDGLLIGLSFASHAHTGVILTIALTIEVSFLGLAVASKATRAELALRIVGFAVLLCGGAAAGAALGSVLVGPLMEGALAFACAALVYLVAEELLVEAHEVPETPLSGAMLCVGFALIMMLDMFAQPPAAP